MTQFRKIHQETYSRETFAALIGVSTKTLYRWDKDGTFVAKRGPGGRPFYTEDDYRKYLSGGQL